MLCGALTWEVSGVRGVRQRSWRLGTSPLLDMQAAVRFCRGKVGP